jgi:hypothetical protein
MMFCTPLAMAERKLNRSYGEMNERPLVMGLKWMEMHPTFQHAFLARRDENAFSVCLSYHSVRKILYYNLPFKEPGACGGVG